MGLSPLGYARRGCNGLTSFVNQVTWDKLCAPPTTGDPAFGPHCPLISRNHVANIQRQGQEWDHLSRISCQRRGDTTGNVQERNAYPATQNTLEVQVQITDLNPTMRLSSLSVDFDVITKDFDSGDKGRCGRTSGMAQRTLSAMKRSRW